MFVDFFFECFYNSVVCFCVVMILKEEDVEKGSEKKKKIGKSSFSMSKKKKKTTVSKNNAVDIFGFAVRENRLVVRSVKAKEEEIGNVFIPKGIKKESEAVIAEVVALSSEAVKAGITVGSFVVFSSYSQTKVKINNQVFLIVKLEDIFLVKNKDEK